MKGKNMAHHKTKYDQEFVNRVHEMKALTFKHSEIAKELNIKEPAVAYIIKNRTYEKISPMDVVMEVFHEEDEKPSLWQRAKKKLKFWQK